MARKPAASDFPGTTLRQDLPPNRSYHRYLQCGRFAKQVRFVARNTLHFDFEVFEKDASTWSECSDL